MPRLAAATIRERRLLLPIVRLLFEGGDNSRAASLYGMLTKKKTHFSGKRFGITGNLLPHFGTRVQNIPGFAVPRTE